MTRSRAASRPTAEVVRNSTFAAYEDDLLTRLIPGGWVVIINTRWHEDDVSGRILPANWAGESGDILCRDGNVWRVLCLQAECQTQTDPLGRHRARCCGRSGSTRSTGTSSG
jgi:hypothetical protein